MNTAHSTARINLSSGSPNQNKAKCAIISLHAHRMVTIKAVKPTGKG